MTTEIAPTRVQTSAEIMERVVIGGDLADLKPAERVMYYRSVCESLGLNPLTKPFEYLKLNNKLVLYARKDCTDQLRRRDAVSIVDMQKEQVGDLLVVTVKAQDRSGRTDMATGAVSMKGLTGEALANAMMKTESKAKRRVTLSLCGLGMLDETEVETIAEARRVAVDPETGEVLDRPASRTSNGTVESDGPPTGTITDPQRKRLWAIARGSGWSEDQVLALLADHGFSKDTDVSRAMYDTLIDTLKSAPRPQ